MQVGAVLALWLASRESSAEWTAEQPKSSHPLSPGWQVSGYRCLTVRCDPSSWEWSENTSRNLWDHCKGTAAVWQNEDDCSFQVPFILIETLANVCSHACRAHERTRNYSGKIHLCINILIRKHGVLMNSYSRSYLTDIVKCCLIGAKRLMNTANHHWLIGK